MMIVTLISSLYAVQFSFCINTVNSESRVVKWWFRAVLYDAHLFHLCTVDQLKQLSFVFQLSSQTEACRLVRQQPPGLQQLWLCGLYVVIREAVVLDSLRLMVHTSIQPLLLNQDCCCHKDIHSFKCPLLIYMLHLLVCIYHIKSNNKFGAKFQLQDLMVYILYNSH